MAAQTGTPSTKTVSTSSTGDSLAAPTDHTGGNFYAIVTFTLNTAAQTVTAVDYAGTAAALISSGRTGGGGAAYFIERWGLVAPPASGTIAYTFSGNVSSHSVIVEIFNDVDQTTPASGAGGTFNASATTSISDTTTSAVGNLVHGVVALKDDDVTGYTDGAGQTVVSNVVVSAGASGGMRTRTYTEAGATTVTISGTWTTSTTAAIADGVSLLHSAFSGGSAVPAISSGYHMRGMR